MIPGYYRRQAERARRLANSQTNPEVQEILRHVAQDYDEVADDIEGGVVEIRHPELLPQRRSPIDPGADFLG